MVCNFTLSHYRDILQAAKGTNLEIVHDIDFPPNNVEQIAQLEASEGFSTKYFVRLHARYYNALSLDNVELFRRIHTVHGHEVGLHFEPSYYPPGSIQQGIDLEAQILEKSLNTSIKYVSLHCTSKGGTIKESEVPHRFLLYSYDSNYYQNKKYISDSGGRWREGCACQHIGKHPSLIVLTHPNWWFQSNPSENF